MKIQSLPTLFERILRLFSLLTVLMILISIVILPHFMNPDVAMYTELGHKLLDGERPYVDYEETNFPMIHVLNALPAALTRVTNLPVTISLQLCLLALLFLSLWFTWRILRLYTSEKNVIVITLFGVVLLAWWQFISMHWGEREHIYTLLYLPFVLLRLARREGKSVGRGMALTIGVMAGIGVTLKPYFILTALFVEGVGVLSHRRWFIRTPEIIGVIFIAGLHILYFTFNPDVLRAFLVLIQRLSEGYSVYPPTPFDKLVSLMLITVILIAIPLLLALLRYRYRVVPAHLMVALSMMGAGGFIGYIIQGKGWNYHAIPFVITNILIVLLLITEGFVGYTPALNLRLQNLIRLIVVSLGVMLSVGMGVFEVLSVQRALVAIDEFDLFTLAPYISTYTEPYDRVMVAHAEIMPTYPVLAALNRRSASRYAFAHPIPIAYAKYSGVPYTDPEHIVPVYAQAYLDAFVADMAKYQPKLVLIHQDGCLPPCAVFGGDMIDYLSGRGILGAVVEPNYTLIGTQSRFSIYVRNDLIQP